jgi:hypothetical protein
MKTHLNRFLSSPPTTYQRAAPGRLPRPNCSVTVEVTHLLRRFAQALQGCTRLAQVVRNRDTASIRVSGIGTCMPGWARDSRDANHSSLTGSSCIEADCPK